MPWGVAAAAIAAGGTIYASRQTAKGSERAAAMEGAMTSMGVAQQQEMYEDYKPFLMSGLEEYQRLLQDPEAYKKSPGYKFRLAEGLKSIGVAGGDPNQRNLTGAQLRAITGYTQDYATSDYDRALQRQAGLTELAGGAAGVAGGIGANISGTLQTGAAQQGRYMQNIANARAAGTLGVTSALGQGMANYGMYQQSQNVSSGPYGTGNAASGDAFQPAASYNVMRP